MPKHKALTLIEKHGTNDPFEIASLEKIFVVDWDLHNEIKGFYKYMRKSRYIFLNGSLSKEMRRFVCAHELGHALLHTRDNTPFLRTYTLFSIDKIEVEANTFAVELLLPDYLISEYSHTNFTIYDACKIYGVPHELAYLKKLTA